MQRTHQRKVEPPYGVSRSAVIPWRFTVALFCLGLLSFLPGCSTTAMPRGSGLVISVPTAQFYKNGPAQDVALYQQKFDNFLTEQKTGPDFQLPKGTHVTLLKRELGYSRVVMDDGQAGYISNDQLAPAPVLARVAAPPPMAPAERGMRDRTRNPNPHSRKIEEPPLDLNDVPLPLPG